MARIPGHVYLKAPRGCLLNTASAAGIYGTAGVAIYSATKFVVRGFTEALDAEWHPDGIRVRALLLSFVDTAILDGVPIGTNLARGDPVEHRGNILRPARPSGSPSCPSAI